MCVTNVQTSDNLPGVNKNVVCDGIGKVTTANLVSRLPDFTKAARK